MRLFTEKAALYYDYEFDIEVIEKKSAHHLFSRLRSRRERTHTGW